MYMFLITILIIFIIIFIINLCVKLVTKNQIITDLTKVKDLDYIIVLGAKLWGDKPSPMLKDRLDKAIEVYQTNPTKIIMSGEHIDDDYDEVTLMKNYAIAKGVKSRDIILDHAGITTYDSIYRLKFLFKAQKVVIITQKYHLYRSLCIANNFALEAYGISAFSNKLANEKYLGDFMREIREIFARFKDLIKSIIKPEAKYMQKTFPVKNSIDNLKKED